MTDRQRTKFSIRDELAAMVPYQPGKPIEEIKREYDLDFTPVKLASNENPYSPPEKIRDVYMREFDNLNRYPDGSSYYLRRAIAKKHRWPAGGVALGCGSDEILDCLAKAMLSPGDEVLIGDPSFAMYKIDAMMMGAVPIEVPLDENFDFNLDRLADNITPDTKWICIPNPNNPTSRYVERDELANFIKKIPENCLLILDEAYFEFMDQPDYPDGIQFLRQNSKDCSIVVLRTFSKAFALAGLRVGYGLMDPELVSEINKVRPPFNVTRPSQAVALAALEADEYIAEVREKISAERKRLVDELESRGIEVVAPCANFMLVGVEADAGAELFCEELLRHGVIVRSMAPYNLEKYFRLSVGTPEENDIFLAALDQIGGF
ncbi:MAG: histidinol-phosphate transaminase [bacterium]